MLNGDTVTVNGDTESTVTLNFGIMSQLLLLSSNGYFPMKSKTCGNLRILQCLNRGVYLSRLRCLGFSS